MLNWLKSAAKSVVGLFTEIVAGALFDALLSAAGQAFSWLLHLLLALLEGLP
ncbi:hypothetical protein [Hymenobacter jeollabukensis]|uniref:hypothetical protein n=1 Tax=Hymenobacter jeollabukensis TaxID=2025313 RepID=UPI001484DA57|nr:hypothetical protein [Hymenobacter jeollabukensis]